MKAFVSLFFSSAAFGIVVATIYWFVSHEPAGTILLGLMGSGLCFAAGYSILAEREADLDGDRPELRNADVSGEDLGIFTTQTAWPILLAFSTLAFIVGAVWFPLLAFTAFAAILLIIWRLGAESSRIT